MKTKTRIFLTMLLIAITSGAFAQQRPSFNKNKDILIACFDIKPDPDDIHAAAALGSMLVHPDLSGVNYFAVAGAYGSQNGNYLQSNSLFNKAFGNNWADAHSNRSAAISAITNKVRPILQNGGKVWVQEGGQSDITADWLIPLINANNSINSTTTKNNVIVVQHDDGFNEKQSNQTKLKNVKDNTRYFLIDDGNAGPNQSWGDHGPWSTPMYRDRSNSFVDQAKNSPNSVAKDLWTEADRLFNSYFPNGFPHDWSFFFSDGVDYSDCVENWWIFEIGNKADTHAKFWNRYVMNTNSNGGGGNNGGDNGGNNGGNNGNSSASYDFGTGGSPVFSGYTRITPSSSNWTNTSSLASRDRGAGPNALNRDFIFSSNARTFEHNVPNGTYDVTVTFGDRDYSRNGQAVKAEGVTKSSNIGTNKNQFVNRSFETTVNDGKLSLEFSTTSGVWCVTRVTIKPASGGGGNNNAPLTCANAPTYNPGQSYAPGERVINNNDRRLYERTANGWDFIAQCSRSQNLDNKKGSFKIATFKNNGDTVLNIESIHGGDIAIDVYNLAGQSIYSERFSTPSSAVSIPLGGKAIASGLYIAKVSLNGQTKTIKFAL